MPVAVDVVRECSPHPVNASATTASMRRPGKGGVNEASRTSLRKGDGRTTHGGTHPGASPAVSRTRHGYARDRALQP